MVRYHRGDELPVTDERLHPRASERGNEQYREIEPEWKCVQTFAVEGMYDGAYSVENLTLEEVDGKTIYKVVSVLPDVAARDGMMASGMEIGVVQGFERLDAILEEFKAEAK